MRIRLYSHLEAVPELFARIYERLFVRQSDAIQFGVSQLYGSITEFPATTIAPDLAGFIHNNVFPDKSVSTMGSTYPFPGGATHLTLGCRGSRYHPAVHDSGYLGFDFDERELFYVDAERGQRQLYPPIRACLSRVKQPIMPLEELILRILGACETARPDPALPHLAVYPEDERGGIEDALLVYHQDRRDFLRDLISSFGLYHWGLGRQAMFERQVALWQLTESERARYQARRLPSFLWQPGITDDVAHREFIQALTLDQVQRLAEYPGDVDALLTYAIQAYPGMRSYTLGERGLMVAIDPPLQGRGSLWRWYADLVELANAS
jgi:hypothetical protein